ncbi:MAG: glycoside hydrolase family 3 C-terminal domain-containing protein [Bacteroidales bacterium]|nr:glycoside hydrolase family 3 C-terminal domain-containing protein [Bacteroidales bacterium]
MIRKYLVALSALLCGALCLAQTTISVSDRERAAELVSKMTLEEKCLLIAGQVDGFHTAAIERLGIPSVRMADGPQGVRNKTRSTYYPCGISLAASFNRSIAAGVGRGIGRDAGARGVRIMLCPGVNIYRSALCGRNFEYYGEDPYLASETAVEYINGIQSNRVIATIKHFALNNQEYDRHAVGSNADERTMNEIYFPTFRKAVEKAHVGAVMTSYNPVNGVHAAEDATLIGQLRRWGHKGVVMSDWTSTYTTLGCLTSGLDLEMPKGHVMNLEEISELIGNGVVTEKILDFKCIRILSLFSAYGLLDKPMVDEGTPLECAESRAEAYAAALEGPVLLKNDGILPIQPKKRNRIVVLGPNADKIPFGGGSGRMDPIEGTTTTLYQGMAALGKKYSTQLMDWKSIDEKALSAATAVIVAVGFDHDTELEGADRSYALPEGQNELIAKVAALNPNVIVVANSGGEFDITPWIDNVKALIMAWYGGQESGKALAAIISGEVSPSGRLPFTFWGSEGANPLSKYYTVFTPIINRTRTNRDPYLHAEYREGVFVGYRGVEHFGVDPMFPFGFGLTYGDFEYSGLSVEPAGGGFNVSFTVRNKSRVKASEAVQLYVTPLDASLKRPYKELKGYDKVELAKGESKSVSIFLPNEAFAHYDSIEHGWVADPGRYVIKIGASSADIRLESEVTL